MVPSIEHDINIIISNCISLSGQSIESSIIIHNLCSERKYIFKVGLLSYGELLVQKRLGQSGQ